MYRDRINEHGDTKVAARRHVGALLDVNPDTLRNWIDRENVDTGTAAESRPPQRRRVEGAPAAPRGQEGSVVVAER
jgi:hypothetical protein